MNYYERQPTLAADGSPTLATDEDRRNEADVKAKLEAAWKCELREMGHLAAIDWYSVRCGRLIGVVEMKSRSHASDAYPTVFLNLRKWLALTLASVGLGCPAIFVVNFTDGVFWIDVAEIDARGHSIGGLKTIKKAISDIEPLIEVPVSSLRRLEAPQ